MNDKYFTIKEVMLSNHCPECYSNEGLQLTFKQKFVETPFYKAISTDTKNTLFCTICNTEIFPGRWTEDIDKIMDYQQKAVVPKSATFKLKKTSWIILVLAIIIIVALNLLLFMN